MKRKIPLLTIAVLMLFCLGSFTSRTDTSEESPVVAPPNSMTITKTISAFSNANVTYTVTVYYSTDYGLTWTQFYGNSLTTSASVIRFRGDYAYTGTPTRPSTYGINEGSGWFNVNTSARPYSLTTSDFFSGNHSLAFSAQPYNEP